MRAARATGSPASKFSAALAGLEESYGCRLAERDPFVLTAWGKVAEGAFKHMVARGEAMEEEIERAHRPVVRAVASELVSQDFFPALATQLERQCPGVEFDCESATQALMLKRLQKHRADCAIAPEDPKWKGFCHERLIELPIVLLCRATSPYRTASDLWALPKITEPLLLPFSTPVLFTLFQEKAQELGVRWPHRRWVSSVMAVTQSVLAGRGIGLTIDFGRLVHGPGLRVLPLKNFPPLPVSAYWHRPGNAFVKAFVELVAREATRVART